MGKRYKLEVRVKWEKDTSHSLMIEVNKRCYMNEQTLEKTEGFVRLRQAILSLYRKILMNG